MDYLYKMWQRARESQTRIVLPEGTEPRTLKAAEIVLKERLADITLLGNQDEIYRQAKEEDLQNIIKKAHIIDPEKHARMDDYAKIIYEVRKSKGVTMEQALQLVKDPLYLGVTMIKAGDADGEVAGARNTTGDVIRPAFQIIKTIPGVSVVSGVFIMMLRDTEFGDDGIMLFADCAVNPELDSKMMADIAETTADTAKGLLGIKPRVAMLSFSTKGSADHATVKKVAEAVELIQKKRPDIILDGEMQLDAAIAPEVARLKAPDSVIQGDANVLIFPSLEAGNIAYKLVQRFAHADAVGPILQGLAAPVNDLSRGCFVRDIVSMIAITACQAINMRERGREVY